MTDEGIGALGERPDSEREGRKETIRSFSSGCAVLEVEGARGYDITAEGLLTDAVYIIGRAQLSK